LAALEAEIASKEGGATKAQEAAKARLEGDIRALEARQGAFERKDDEEGGKNKGVYAAIKAKEDETSEEIEKGKEAGSFAAMVAAENKTASEKEAEAKRAKAEMERAMKSGISGQTNYNTAELNMLRAQKALEKARASGNAEAILGAEQQLEGAR
jgi:hypothetical protein